MLMLAVWLLGVGTARAQQPRWIWNEPQAAEQAGTDPVVFRKTFEVAGPIEQLEVTLACDNRFEAYLDGVSIGRGDNWQQPQRFVLTRLADGDSHVLAVRAKNDGVDPAGLAAQVVVKTAGDATVFVSDKSWTCALESAAPALWWQRSPAPSDAWQPAAELGVVGTAGPWGNRIAWDSPETSTIETVFRAPQEKFEFVDGDRVTMIGGTWIERLQVDNFFETIVTSAYPDRNIQFRNLGWSGDEVTGIARAVFGSPQDGFARLRDDLLRTRPTVILVGYGGNEAFRGEAGLESFHAEWSRLVELLESTGATLVFISPPRHENVGPPLPDPTMINAQIDLYSAALREWAETRGHHFVDFGDPRLEASNEDSPASRFPYAMTENGLHFTSFGRWVAAQTLARRLNVPDPTWRLAIDVGSREVEATGTTANALEVGDGRVRWVVQDDRLALPSLPPSAPRNAEFLKPMDVLAVNGLPEGRWGLNINGRPAVLATAEEWAQGVVIDRSSASPVEALRGLVSQKNELYFHRYRPQNETYLFLFRKHEQGNNAVEIPQFDPIVERVEQEIRSARQPRSIAMELVPLTDE
ncbi:MAG: hypothetical protein KDA83_11105 [Planctomycetales bacterium]|nr:hypothetical protein [Planctomycetales bacterium]